MRIGPRLSIAVAFSLLLRSEALIHSPLVGVRRLSLRPLLRLPHRIALRPAIMATKRELSECSPDDGDAAADAAMANSKGAGSSNNNNSNNNNKNSKKAKVQMGLDAFVIRKERPKKDGGEGASSSSGAATAAAAAPVDPAFEAKWETQLGPAWYGALKSELCQSYFTTCIDKVDKERRNKKVYPPEELVFNAFRSTPLDKVKVVIVGQDPYHQPKQAMGLCFSVPRGVQPPPSLKNMFEEIGCSSSHGDLTSWTEQGVFLLNALLTVAEGSPMSHKDMGWARFTDRVIDVINRETKGTIFLLWGKAAQKKGEKINRSRHHVLEAGHPSPLSIKHFEGCQHFQRANAILEKRGEAPIQWELPQ
ncbi:unnamed protein product [Vitrella brassicaformis CCMP3155]|uniref:Uracil-DNA glycosylase n=2 Tax=Vitrella brassicaformis TaxID=1169539 RepID=A0A0G4ERF9_VITBC|nr:unnamed protein product [Vitrella brassicaformis CCMP3155]|mmetsp:Transcript_18923/g.45591  ORF Transcript_18923/g.45591 Transcript_18923/m.45591 type:complete len:363 (+) Transcript_18923:50-1138(+)|eukprot:CEM00619.1 unnamed protein product [Vitrella brassicaformis CCMP3155]